MNSVPCRKGDHVDLSPLEASPHTVSLGQEEVLRSVAATVHYSFTGALLRLECKPKKVERKKN
jgi:hypothetical protein